MSDLSDKKHFTQLLEFIFKKHLVDNPKGEREKNCLDKLQVFKMDWFIKKMPSKDNINRFYALKIKNFQQKISKN